MSLFSFFSGNTATAYQNISSEDFQNLVADGAQILDVRTAGEVSTGRIPGAQHLDIMRPDFAQKVAQLDKSKTWLVYCRSGARSASACKVMADAGFEKLYNLRGGISAYSGRISR